MRGARPKPCRHPQSGMTLVEVLVALAVFAVIGTAGFALLDQTLRSQRLSEARLTRLDDLQRMMRIVTLDTMQAVPDTLAIDKADVTFLRQSANSAPDTTDTAGRLAGMLVHYRLGTEGLQRQIGPEGSQPPWQLVLPGVKSVAWQPIFRPDPTLPASVPPKAAGLDLTVQLTASESVRGVFVLPSAPLREPLP